MGRKSFVPIEIDFLFGLDKHTFCDLSNNERMVYIYLWSHTWHAGLDEILTPKSVLRVLTRCSINTRYLHKWLTNIASNNLIEYWEGSVKLLGLNHKRQVAMRKKVDQNDVQNDSVVGTKEKEKEEVKEKEKKNHRGGIDSRKKPVDKSQDDSSIFHRMYSGSGINSYDLSIVSKLKEEKLDGTGIFSALVACFEKAGVKYDKSSDMVGVTLNTAFQDMPTDGTVVHKNKYLVTCALNLAQKKVEEKNG